MTMCTRIWLLFRRFSSAAVIFCLAAPPAPLMAEESGEIVIVALGDSLSAGYRLPPAASFPAQLERALREKGHAVRIVNAGVSGDTAADGLARLDWATPDDADAVIVELGANDALRGIAPAVTGKALDGIMGRLKGKGLEVLLAGMEAPRNWGQNYVAAFAALYPQLAERHDALLYPFFLDGVALEPALTLDDGMHPNERGIAVIVERILPAVERLMERVVANRAGAG